MMSRSGLRAGDFCRDDSSGLMGGRERQSRPWLNATAAITLPVRRTDYALGDREIGARAGVGPCQTVGPRSDVGADGAADQVGEPGGQGAQDQLAEGAAEERAVGQPGHQAATHEGGERRET